jgi:hypothetical protein
VHLPDESYKFYHLSHLLSDMCGEEWKYEFCHSVQNVCDLRGSCVVEGQAEVKFCTSGNWVYTSSALIMYAYAREFTEIQPAIQTSDQPLNDCPTACVIIQHCSSSTLISLCFCSHKENFLLMFQNCYFFNTVFFKNCVFWKTLSQDMSVLMK